jgi:pilus assembly protein Flp/PilA
MSIFLNAQIFAERRFYLVLFLPREEGQGLVEYALILVLVAIVVIAILLLLGPVVGNVFSNIVSNL